MYDNVYDNKTEQIKHKFKALKTSNYIAISLDYFVKKLTLPKEKELIL